MSQLARLIEYGYETGGDFDEAVRLLFERGELEDYDPDEFAETYRPSFDREFGNRSRHTFSQILGELEDNISKYLGEDEIVMNFQRIHALAKKLFLELEYCSDVVYRERIADATTEYVYC